MPSACAVLVAAGSGRRAGLIGGRSKQWALLGGKPVVRWSAETFCALKIPVAVVIHPDDQAMAEAALQGLSGIRLVPGGAERADSVRAGLRVFSDLDPTVPVLIHDAARPLLEAAHVHALLAALDVHDGALLALPVTDTLKSGTLEAGVTGTVARDGLWRAQTPQAFRLSAILTAYAALPDGTVPTDDVQVAEQAGLKIALVPGDGRLMKLTYPEDFAMAEAILSQTQAPPARVMRVGQGFDAHRWGPGESVWLCGVEITHTQTLIGHSDADAGLHALTDAILGALGEGDIGDHFPPTDPKWKGASSDQFLLWAAARVRAVGGAIINVDVTLICEQPKIKPHRDAMRQRLCELLGLAPDAVSVKATTTEKMGFTGRGEGLAAQAICL
ncbi:MAG: bifunctional 2-C-methyl-D-erythritol 4-phosphate cytidylyltransferase/2-C-methyl-D-erythritol 2,4-cyclodiphosphate synthase, partial [Asticcacaulis sp.]